MKLKLNCPYCKKNKIKYIRKLKSNINNKYYDLNYCLNCGLEFFSPLIFENIYETELCEAYSSHHNGKKSYLEWTKELIFTLKKFNLNYKNLSILDVGAGDCINYKALKEFFHISNENYTAIELDNKSCLICKKRGVKNIIPKKFDNKILKDFKKNSFDIIISTEVIEHQIDLKDYVDTLFNLIKPGGFIFLTTPNRDRLFLKLREQVGGDVPPNHFLRFNKTFFKKNFKKNLIYINEYSFNNIKGFSVSISLKLFSNGKFWMFFIPISIIYKFFSIFKPDGLVIVLSKKKE
jgi:2-polyprenyl-3-methyl-5-hydroxy-6-metoxy-1,4-benzoquinol methylase